MSNEMPQNSNPPATLPASTSNAQQQWKGLTMDELKMRRAKQLVLREVNRASLSYQLNNARENVSQNGIRGLLFNDKERTGLKKADYAFLGYKAIALLIKLYTRRHRH